MPTKFFLLTNIKMPTIVGILMFISRKNFMLNWVEYEKSFITLGPVLIWKNLSSTPEPNHFLTISVIYPCKFEKNLLTVSRGNVPIMVKPMQILVPKLTSKGSAPKAVHMIWKKCIQNNDNSKWRGNDTVIRHWKIKFWPWSR